MYYKQPENLEITGVYSQVGLNTTTLGLHQPVTTSRVSNSLSFPLSHLIMSNSDNNTTTPRSTIYVFQIKSNNIKKHAQQG